MRTNIILCALAICLLAISCNNNIVITSRVDTPIRIFPDYDKVTVPVNIAPLNFSVMEDTGEAGFQAVSFAVPLAVLIIGILIIVLPGRIRRKRLATEELENIKKAFSEGANK